MEKKVSTFNEDTLLQEMALNSDLNRRARLAEEKRKLDEGLAIGKQEGKVEQAKETACKYFTKKFPNEDTAFLDNLTLEQYEKITDLVIEDVSLDEIKKSIE